MRGISFGVGHKFIKVRLGEQYVYGFQNITYQIVFVMQDAAGPFVLVEVGRGVVSNSERGRRIYFT